MLARLLAALVVVPVLGFLGVIAVPKRQERMVYAIAMATVLLESITLLAFGAGWFRAGFPPVSASVGVLYQGPGATLSLDLFFDTLSAVFFSMATVTTALVLRFSRPYMHREQGFKRFFYTVLLFFVGLSLTILAGNFEVLLVGWECIGISSVLLIAFYRDRYLPVRNALKVFSVYRIADAFLLLAIWYAHHAFEGSVHVAQFPDIAAVHGSRFAVLGLLVYLAALMKSAQFPFSYWLPRAMEGPTTSSAIFYGALSVHIGIFLVLRTYPLWEGSAWLRWAIACSGLVTAVVASSIARVQSSSKTQIAYASITQIGIMYIEVAAGLPWVALVHFVSNASLRTYQLLISPSMASYLVHDQFFNFTPPSRERVGRGLGGRLRATAYVLGIKEWGMNSAATRYIWMPLKSVGRAFAFLDTFRAQAAALVLAIAIAAAVGSASASAHIVAACSVAAAAISLLLYIRAHATKHAAEICWNLIMLGQVFGAVFLASASAARWDYLVLYGAGIVTAFILGHICLWRIRTRGGSTALRTNHGYIGVAEPLGIVFFIACLLFMAFPVSPSFVAQDILFSQIPASGLGQAALFCLSYILMGLSVMRLYMKLFFGPYEQSPHDIAYRSS